MNARRALFCFFCLFLLFPYGILLFKVSLAGQLDLPELWWAFKNSVWQASLSTVGSLLLGIWLCLGFFRLQRWKGFQLWMSRLLEIGLLLPSFLPPLFLLLVMLSMVNPFPTGIAGVVLIHVMMNAGLVALLLKSLVESKMKPLLELAWLEGSSQFQFLKSAWGMAARDLYAISLFVFILCFASFSVPLIAGGGKATTLEILIYEKIRITGNWGEGLSLSLIQLLLIMALSWVSLSPRRKLFGRAEKVPLLGSAAGALAVLFYSFAFFIYFAFESVAGWQQVLLIPGLLAQATEVLPFSLFFGFSVGLCTASLLLLTAWASPYPALHRLVSGLVSPSTALLGFALLMFGSNEEPWNWIKWIFGFSYLIFSTLYRWGWDQEVSGLADQVQVAETLGASRGLVFKDILWPQLVTPASRMAGIASLWALGDFALGKILVGQDLTLSLLIETLMSSYRLQAALALMGLLLLMGAFCYFTFWGIAYVSRRALE